MQRTTQSNTKVLVYVQAVPKSLPSGARRFNDFSRADFVMTHSSKSALAKSGELFKDSEIIAAGHNSILYEALARGASIAITLPLCDDPLDQAKSFPSNEHYTHIVVGENPDGFFSGASLCGAIASLRKIPFGFLDLNGKGEGLYLLKDDGSTSHNIDVRRIENAFNARIAELGALGTSSFGKIDETPKSENLSSFSPEEIATAVARRLRRLTIQ